ncbi:MAG: helix-turn-helix domain-containing protein, partial [Bacteroidota bacterium]
PEVALDFHPLQVGMKEVLVVEIHESQDKPVRCLNEENEWEVYIRSKDQCLLASEMSIRMLRNEDPQGEDAPVLEFGSKRTSFVGLSAGQAADQCSPMQGHVQYRNRTSPQYAPSVDSIWLTYPAFSRKRGFFHAWAWR